MINRLLIIKGLLVIIAELIIISLLLSGVVMPNYNNTVLKNEISAKGTLADIISSNNYIYTENTVHKNGSFYNITISKYNTELKSLWNYTFSSSYINLIAATDKTVMTREDLSINNKSQTILNIINQNGIESKLNTTSLGNGTNFQNAIAVGSNYLLTSTTSIDNQTNLFKSYLYQPNGNLTKIYEFQFNSSLSPLKPLYKDSNIIEFPFLSFEKKSINQASGFPYLYYIISNELFLQYNVLNNSFERANIDIMSLYNKIQNLFASKYTNSKSQSTSAIFLYDNNFLVLNIRSITNSKSEQTQFTVWSNQGKLASNTQDGSYAMTTPLAFLNHENYFIEPTFQIKNKCYFEFTLTKMNNSGKSQGSGFLTYSKYAFTSALNFGTFKEVFNIPNIDSVGMLNVNDHIIYFGVPFPLQQYFIETFNLRTSFFDTLYQIPILIKILLEIVLIIPVLIYLKSRMTIDVNPDTYPSKEK